MPDQGLVHLCIINNFVAIVGVIVGVVTILESPFSGAISLLGGITETIRVAVFEYDFTVGAIVTKVIGVTVSV
ncbi:hypothetical protein F8M41_026529 [Gigaspora margarita]|uniref:Uncharacterized protein n=1 Tax=Gigaspora margarita TaxID=4874 RepID=A0A8H3XJR9_GIGMA|nr:hypothetical protein F8M41_026529 [Gigaspora margarita]